jgi:protein N-terminal amidase
MAWSTHDSLESFRERPYEPDMASLKYWLARLEPVIRGETDGEILVVLANRCGNEDETVYVGSSCVVGIDHGKINVYGILGRGEEKLLVVDTNAPPTIKLAYLNAPE